METVPCSKSAPEGKSCFFELIDIYFFTVTKLFLANFFCAEEMSLNAAIATVLFQLWDHGGEATYLELAHHAALPRLCAEVPLPHVASSPPGPLHVPQKLSLLLGLGSLLLRHENAYATLVIRVISF